MNAALLARASNGRRFISDVVEVAFDRTERTVSLKPVFTWDYASDSGKWVDVPAWFDEAVFRGICSEEEVLEWLQAAAISPSRFSAGD